MSKTAENITVVVIVVAILIGLFCFIGYDNIKEWLSTPFVWKKPDFLHIEFVDALEEKNDKKILFLIYNTSEHLIDYYRFQVVTDMGVVEFNSLNASTVLDGGFTSGSNDIAANGFTTLSYTCSRYNGLSEAYEYFKKLNSNDIEKLQYRIVRLESRTETLISNNGWLKIIAILAVSILAGVLVLNDIVKVTWLRIIMKIMCVPAILIILAVGIVLLAGGDKESSARARASSDKQTRERAAANYKRAANLKAGALAHGDTQGAARAQAEMDRAMADMVTGNAQSGAKANYKREAQLRAGAQIQGNQKEAVKAQSRMDRHLADMIRDK